MRLKFQAQAAEQPNSVNLIWLPGDWAANTAAAKDAKANAIIIRTMFETDRIPPDWVITCNNMDEIWVPTQFNVETFTAAGVNRNKLFVIPQGIDSDRFSPDVIPRDWPDKKGFNFLSVFVWQDRKGWDVLLKAYLTKFNIKDDVALILLSFYPPGVKDGVAPIWRLWLRVCLPSAPAGVGNWHLCMMKTVI